MKVLLDTNAYSALKRGVDAVVEEVVEAEGLEALDDDPPPTLAIFPASPKLVAINYSDLGH